MEKVDNNNNNNSNKNIKLNIVLEQPKDLKDVSIDMTVTATTDAIPKPTTPIEMSLNQMVEEERIKALMQEEDEDDEQASKQHIRQLEIDKNQNNNKLRLQTPPIINGINTNVKLNLNLDRQDSPTLNMEKRDSGGMSPFRSRPSTGGNVDIFVDEHNIKPIPPTVNISSTKRSLKTKSFKSPKAIKLQQQYDDLLSPTTSSPKSPLSYMQQNVSLHDNLNNNNNNNKDNTSSPTEYLVQGIYPPTKRPTSSYSNRDLANITRRETDFFNRQREDMNQQHRMEITLRAKEQRDQYKLNVYKRNLYSSSGGGASSRPSTTGSMSRTGYSSTTSSSNDTMDIHKLKQITANETRKLLLLEQKEDRREVVLKQKELEKQLLEEKDMFFARKLVCNKTE